MLGSRFRRGLLLTALVLLAWGLLLLVTGGILVETRWGHVSSRAPSRPIIASGLLLLFYAVRFRQHWEADHASLLPVSWPHVIAGTAVVMTLVVGVKWGTRIAGGPDPSGYVSQGALLARGELVLPAPRWAADAPWTHAELSAAPIGYRPSRHRTGQAPTYAPGLPLIMAAAQVAGGTGAVFYVVPVLGAIGVWATWLLGCELGGRWVGAFAAALVSANATFLLMLIQPMSDVPAATLWTLSLAASLRGRPVGAGAAAAVAILVRPNLVPLVGVPLLVLLLPRRTTAMRTFLSFTVPTLPAAGLIAFLNWYYYGSPVFSGYGSLADLYSVERVWLNIGRYGSWFFYANTPLMLLGLLAPAFFAGGSRMRLLLVVTVFPLALLGLYLPYFVFAPHEWTFLRFLLPGFPPLAAGFVICVREMWRRVLKPSEAIVATMVLVGGLSAYGWHIARQNGLYELRRSDERYAHAVRQVRTLPAKSVLVSLVHSGTLRFYTGRDVLRYEAIESGDIDRALSFLEGRGYRLYFVGDYFEVDVFRARFPGTQAASRLSPAAMIDVDGAVVCPLTAAN